MTPSVVVLGNLIVDDVVFDDGSTRMAQPGGAVLYSALGARLWDHHVGCVSVRGHDYPQAMIECLRARGVELDGVRTIGRPGLRAWLLYEGRLRHLVHRLGCPTHEEASPEADQIPRDWLAARVFHLAPMPFEVQRRLVQALAGEHRAFVSVDPHRPVTAETIPDWRALLADADAFFPSEDELTVGGLGAGPEEVLPQLASGRLRFVVFKRGADGGVLYDAHERRFHRWLARADRVVDQTGAGDAFATGFASAFVDGLPVEQCLQRAIVGASVAIESTGPEGLLTRSPADAAARADAWFGAARPS